MTLRNIKITYENLRDENLLVEIAETKDCGDDNVITRENGKCEILMVLSGNIASVMEHIQDTLQYDMEECYKDSLKKKQYDIKIKTTNGIEMTQTQLAKNISEAIGYTLYDLDELKMDLAYIKNIKIAS